MTYTKAECDFFCDVAVNVDTEQLARQAHSRAYVTIGLPIAQPGDRWGYDAPNFHFGDDVVRANDARRCQPGDEWLLQPYRIVGLNLLEYRDAVGVLLCPPIWNYQITRECCIYWAIETELAAYNNSEEIAALVLEGRLDTLECREF